MNRTIKFIIDSDFPDADEKFKKPLFQSAIGYLVSWGSQRLNSVTVYCGKDGNLSADYYDETGRSSFHIHGQLGNDGTYSFHS